MTARINQKAPRGVREPGLHARARGLVLLAVIVVVAIAALVGTTAMYLSGAEMASASGSLHRVQARALAWSGVQAAMAEIADQRGKLLDGAAPVLTREWELFTDDSGVRGVVRLAGDEPASSESAKLDVNSATEEMLAKVPGIDQALAKAIVTARQKSPIASVEDLARVPGITPEKLRAGEADGEAGSDSASRTGGLADLLTVFSFDPNVQSGLGQDGSDHRGALRLNLQTSWSDRLGQAIDERFGSGSGATVKALMDKGTAFKTLADVVNAARTSGIQPKDWAGVLDAFTVTDDPYLVGRVDLIRAPAAVLAAIPGISAEAAAQIVTARDKVDDESRRSPAWIASQGILTGEQFAQAVDHLTSRSMQWRVRVEAGILPRDESGGAERIMDAALSDRVLLDAVIDVSSERPRVAYLREVTMLETARALAVELAAADEERPSKAGSADLPDEGAAGAAAGTGAPATSADNGTGIRSALDLSTGMDKGFGDLNLHELNLGEKHLSDPIQGEESAPAGGQMGPPAPEPAGQEAVDRRLGRWTTGKSGTKAGKPDGKADGSAPGGTGAGP